MKPQSINETRTTCMKAAELSKRVGTRIHWRPSGAVENWQLPEMDLALVISGTEE